MVLNLTVVVNFFQKKKENLDIIEEAINGDRSAIKMLFQEYRTQSKIYA